MKNTKEYFIDNIFVIGFILLAIFLNISFSILLIYLGFDILSNKVGLFIFWGWNLTFAYRLMFIYLSFLPDKHLPQLSHLQSLPSVAILYLTKDDASEEKLRLLENQEYDNYKVYILDDSKNSESFHIFSQFNYTVVKRNNNIGYKAGNMNNWLSKFGKQFDYFVVLDSDSIIPNNFITEMLKYAEHPQNSNVAIFQSRLCAEKTINIISKYQAILLKLQQHIILKYGNRLTTTQNWGHNILVRTNAVFETKGFDERFVGEDVATTFALYEKHYVSRFVDIPSWEEVTFSLNAFVKKTVRITLSNLQIVLFNKSQVSLFQILLLFMSIFPYILFVASLMIFLDAIYLENLPNIGIEQIYFLIKTNYYYLYNILILWLYFFVSFFYDYILFRNAKISFKKFIIVKFISFTLMLHLIIPLLLGIFRVIFVNKFVFTVTTKNTNFKSINKNSIIPVFIYTSLFWGIIFFHPIVIIFNIYWYIMILVSPLLLLFIERDFKNRIY